MNSLVLPLTKNFHRVYVEDANKNYQFAISTERFINGKFRALIGSGLQWETCALLPNKRPGNSLCLPSIALLKRLTTHGLIYRGDHHQENLVSNS